MKMLAKILCVVLFSFSSVASAQIVHKFGAAPDIDTGDGEVTMWDGAEDGTAWENMVYNYSESDDIDGLSSSSDLDDQIIHIEGVDSSFNLVTQEASLNGTNRVALATPLFRVFRAYNAGTSNLNGNVFICTNDVLAAGVPADAEGIRAVIHSENNQTEMAMYTVPKNFRANITSIDAATAGANKDSSYIVRLFVRNQGGAFRLQKKFSISDTGTQIFQYKMDRPMVLSEGTDVQMTIEVADAGITEASLSGGFDLELQRHITR